MKVAISLPDPVFADAEKLAKRLHISRSQLYVQALQEYLDKRADNRVTERLDAVYAAQTPALDAARLDAGLDAAQREVIGDEAW